MWLILHAYINSLAQGCSNSIANALQQSLNGVIWTNDDKFTNEYIHHLASQS